MRRTEADAHAAGSVDAQRRPGRSTGRRAGVAVPVAVAVLALLVLVGVRLAVPCHGDPGCFVVAGAQFTDPARSGLPVLSGPEDDGYDGQFFWRLSRSPHELQSSPVHGVVLDTPIRVGRPAYPAVVWAASLGGREGLVDWMLIAVNVVLTGGLALLLAVLARRHGVPPWIGALAALWPGLLFAVGRDLSEPGSALLVVAGLAAVRRGRPAEAGLLWAAAVLWREQAIVVPAAYGCWWLFLLLRGRSSARSVPAVAAWSVPLVAFLTWQAVVAQVVGQAPVLASGEQNAVLPLTGLLPELAGWVRLEDGTAGLVWLFELAVAVAVVTAALVVGVRDRRWEVLAVGAAAVLVLSASRDVWGGPAHLRYASDVVATAWFVLLSRPGSAGRAAASGRDLRGGLVLAQAAAALLACSSLVRSP